jgi:hypothetical protein
MSLRSFFFGDINESDAWELPTEEEEPNYGSPLQDLSNELESRTGVSLHQCSHTEKHGLLGLAGYVDEQHRNLDQAWEAFEDGRLTESEFGYAVGTYHDAENHKPGWKYFLGL